MCFQSRSVHIQCCVTALVSGEVLDDVCEFFISYLVLQETQHTSHFKTLAFTF